jgi:hypothetical protein
MGLDFQGSDAHWSYGGFHRFRLRLSAAIDLDFEGFCEGKPATEANAKDPIFPLLNHSDCDGDLSPEDCATVAPRLREMVAPWPEDDYDKHQALLLAEGMEECAKNGESLEFC